MKALVHIENGQLIQLIADSETQFDTHSDYAWKDFDETGLAYNPVPEQLDQLWHDIDEGKLGETAKTGTWYLGVKSTKAAYPKT